MSTQGPLIRPLTVSAYVPCFNEEVTVGRTIASLLTQTMPVTSVLVIDDASTDRSVEVASSAGAGIVQQPGNAGRGAARALGMEHCRTDFVLSCDAGKTLAPDFLERSLIWFEDARVAAVFGRLRNYSTRTPVERWRARHLFREDEVMAPVHRAPLITAGAVVRRALVEEVGGYDRGLRHSEDRDLSDRLLRCGYDVVFDPALTVYSVADETTRDLLERYWRWTAGVSEQVSFTGYRRSVGYALRTMVVADLRAGDPLSAIISCVAPHYCFWRTRARLWFGAAQAKPAPAGSDDR